MNGRRCRLRHRWRTGDGAGGDVEPQPGATTRVGVEEAQRAAVQLGDPSRDGQPQTGADALRLGREVRVENRVAILRRHPETVVGYPQPDARAVRVGSGSQPGGQMHAPRPIDLGECLLRVDQQVEDDLADLVGIDRIMMGTDYSFPPADLTPMRTLQAAGFSASQIQQIAEGNPRRMFRIG